MSDEREALRVFISYARRDATAFADELVKGLEVAGFDAFVDRHDIAAGEDWEARLGGLIQSADTVVFIITPGAIASERCAWEVARAEELSKRVIPIVLIDVPEDQTPERLRRLNYIFFTEGNSYSGALVELAKALRLDLDWIREHTRLADLARRWEARQRADVLLLRGSELDAARIWLAAWKAPAPLPLDLHRAFIAASDLAEGSALNEERKRLRNQTMLQRGLAAVTALALGATLMGGWLVFQARRDVAESASVILATLALDHGREEDYVRGLRLALAASQDAFWYDVAPEVAEALAYNASALPLRAELEGHQRPLSAATLLPDGQTLATASATEGTLRTWNLATGEVIGEPLALGDEIAAVAISEQGNFAASATFDGVVRVWNVRERRPHGPEIQPERDPDATRQPRVSVVLLGETGTLLTIGYRSEIWDGLNGRRLALLNQNEDSIQAHAASKDLSRIATLSRSGAVTIWDAGAGMRTIEAPEGSERIGYGFLSLSDDGRRMAVQRGQTVEIWNVEASERIAPAIPLTTMYTNGVTLSSTGASVLVTYDKSIEVWNAESGQRVFSFPTRDLRRAQFSPNGDDVAVLHGDGVLSLIAITSLSPQENAPEESVVRDDEAINGFEFSRDSRFILTRNANRTLRMWRTVSGERFGPSLRQDALAGFRFISNEIVLTANTAGAIRLWDIARFTPPAKEIGAFENVSMSEDGTMLLTEGSDEVGVWSLADGMPTQHRFQMEGLRGATPVANHSIVFVYGPEQAVVWHTATDQRTPLQLREGMRVYSASLSLDGSRVATRTNGGRNQVWNGTTGALIWESADPEYLDMEMSPRADIFTVVGFSERNERDFSVRSAADGAVLTFTGEAPSATRWHSFSPDGSYLIIATASGVSAWTSDGKALTSTMRLDVPDPTSVVFSPTSKTLVVFGRRQAHLWNLETDARERLAHDEGQDPVGAAFTADGARFVTWTSTQARIWASADGEPQVGPFAVDVREMRFSPDGQRLAALGPRSTLYNAGSGRPIAVLPSGEFIGMSADSSRVVMRSDGMRIFELPWLASRASIRDFRAEVCAALTARDGALSRGDSLRRITARDVVLAPVLRGREGEDVCA